MRKTPVEGARAPDRYDRGLQGADPRQVEQVGTHEGPESARHVGRRGDGMATQQDRNDGGTERRDPCRGDDPHTGNRAGDREDHGGDGERGEQHAEPQPVVADQVDRDSCWTTAPPTLTAIVVRPVRATSGTR